jgi:hypothetical protein|tara:strand:- start:857 stop:973 length:117 start_codon:yes stop_codon:yes gene_type:complete
MRIATRKKQRLAGVENGADGVIMNPRHAQQLDFVKGGF